jgi:glycine cleavage system H protein
MGRPANFKYAASHEWASNNGGVVTIGITDFAVHQLNDLTFVDLPDVGDKVTKGESFGEIESVKAVSDLYAPCSGEVVAVNDGVDGDDFAKMKTDAFGAGWLIKIKASNPGELDAMMGKDAYEAQLGDH